MLDAQDNLMLFKPGNRALQALLWLVIIVVPGGLFLFAVLAADAAARRLRTPSALPEAALGEAPLSSLGNTPS